MFPNVEPFFQAQRSHYLNYINQSLLINQNKKAHLLGMTIRNRPKFWTQKEFESAI